MQMNLFTFIILSLASYRLTHLLVFDKVFEPIRTLFVKRDVYWSTDGPQFYFFLQGGPIRRTIGMILNCFWCCGMYSAMAITAAYLQWPTFTYWICLALAIAAVQSLTEQAWTKSVGLPEFKDGDAS